MIDKIGELTYKSINAYGANIKPIVNELKFKEEYQGRIIDCMVGEVDDNYIETPETDAPVVKLEHSKEGVVKIPSIKGKTILVDSEGNETDTPGEGCRLISVGESEDNRLLISSKNKNIFDGKLEIGSIEGSNGQNIVNENCVRSANYIKVFSGQDYVSNLPLIVSEYDVNKTHLQTISWNRGVYNPSVNCSFIRFRRPNGNNDLNEKIQIELGVTVSEYIEPKSHKTEILLNEPVRSLPNGVCDEIMGNQIIRRVGKIIFKGNESWRLGGWSNNERVELYGSDLNIINLKNKGSLKCNIFKALPHSNAINDTYIDCIMCGKYISIFIDANRLVTNDLKGAKLWLSENPTEVLYELSEPIIEELPNSITIQGFDDTTMYIENEISPTVQYGYNALIPYKQELLNQKEEVETNTLDIEQNIIPYLMDMEFNLMLMEGE